MIQNPLGGMLVYIVFFALGLLWAPLTPLCAAEPVTLTPALTQTAIVSPATSTPQPVQMASTVEPTETPTAGPVDRQADKPANELVDEPAATATPDDTVQPGTARRAILVSECVVPVGGTASSDVFVHLEDVHPGIVRLQLVLHFDPQVVHVQDVDENAANGTQVALAAFFAGAQTTVENRADNTRGEVTISLAQTNRVPVSGTASWQKVATIVWIGRQAGNSALTIGEQSSFADLAGQSYAPTAVHHSTVFARAPGQVRGQVLLQGRAEHGNTQVSSTLAETRVNRSYTGLDGSFVLTATHGEGFYTLSASAPGYLTAEGSRPVKLTVGNEVELAPITLLGGDINQDNLIDIRDLSFIAYHLGGPDAQSDLNGDGQVDILDLTLIAGNFGKRGPITWPISD